MKLKKRLAWEIVQQFHGARAANEAQRYFAKVFQKRELPEEIPEYFISAAELTSLTSFKPAESLRQQWQQSGLEITPDDIFADVPHLLASTALTKNISEAKRLIAQGAVKIGNQRVRSNIFPIRNGSIVVVGKRRFVKIAIK